MICASIINPGAFQGGGNPGTAPLAIFLLPINPGPLGAVFPFIDQSTGNPTSWAWFVSGSTQFNTQNAYFYPIHAGSYQVTLTVTNSYGSNTSNPQTLVVTTGTPP